MQQSCGVAMAAVPAAGSLSRWVVNRRSWVRGKHRRVPAVRGVAKVLLGPPVMTGLAIRVRQRGRSRGYREPGAIVVVAGARIRPMVQGVMEATIRRRVCPVSRVIRRPSPARVVVAARGTKGLQAVMVDPGA